jgi:hypothetical protein
LRAHVQSIWQIACTLTGDEATAVEVVRQVVGGTLPQPSRFRQRGLRLEIVIAATEAAAARVFSPLDRRARSGAYAAALGLQAAALRRAFSRRVSWDVQALLWATEVEDIAESDVTHRLAKTHSDRAAGRVALRLAYFDLRGDLDEDCKAALRNAFRFSADPEERDEDPHLASCDLCQAEVRWLTDLRSALLSLTPPMPPEVWREARRLALGDTRRESYDVPRSNGAHGPGHAITATPWSSPMDSRRAPVVVVSAADQSKAAVGGATTARHCTAPALGRPAAEHQKVQANDVKIPKVESRKLVGRVVFR